MLAPLHRFLRGDIMTGGPGINRAVVSASRRWTRISYLCLPLLLLLNFAVIFEWTYFQDLPTKVLPAKWFHPPPVPETPHTLEAQDEEGPDYWTWDTPTRFGNYVQKEQEGEEEEIGCETFPKYLLEKIQVVLKAGVADHPDRTNAQLASVIKCIDNVFIVSDHNYTYGGSKHEAIDVIASLNPKSYMKAEDYAVYESQKEAKQGGLKQGHDGWKIDKYKFLPAVEYAVAQNPSAEWFVFLESDTYIFWDNVFRLLENYDHTLPYYFGSPSPGKKLSNSKSSGKRVWFAYGGCGFILSNNAAHRLVYRKRNSIGVTGPRLADEYKQNIKDDCCGDSILGWALQDKAGIGISGLWPMFNPHDLSGIPFGELYWCEPVISLHKTTPQDFRSLWEWEMTRDRSQRPLLYADLLAYHGLGTFTRHPNWDATDWDGFSPSDEDPAHRSLGACEAACKSLPECYQWTWHGDHCYMARSIRLGHYKQADGHFKTTIDREFTSGWDVEKIERWRMENPCTEGPHWVKPSIKRKF